MDPRKLLDGWTNSLTPDSRGSGWGLRYPTWSRERCGDSLRSACAAPSQPAARKNGKAPVKSIKGYVGPRILLNQIHARCVSTHWFLAWAKSPKSSEIKSRGLKTSHARIPLSRQILYLTNRYDNFVNSFIKWNKMPRGKKIDNPWHPISCHIFSFSLKFIWLQARIREIRCRIKTSGGFWINC